MKYEFFFKLIIILFELFLLTFKIQKYILKFLKYVLCKIFNLKEWKKKLLSIIKLYNKFLLLKKKIEKKSSIVNC